MNIIKDNLTIRNAAPTDAELLCAWWNDGRVMAHAGFPNGLGTTAEEICKDLATDTDETHRRHIIEYGGKAIGEMNYRDKGDGVAEMGIKICDFTQQNKGLGTRILSMFIDALFCYRGYEKIILDTSPNNKRSQHVYGKLGFKQIRVRENAWRDQLGVMQTAIDYELKKADWLAGQGEPLRCLYLRPERPNDRYAVEEITREAHWEHNWGAEPRVTDVHLLVHRLRKSACYVPELHIVAETGSKLVGHIMYAKSKVVDEGGAEHEVLTFGPLSVLPDYQNMGVGKALVKFSLGEARRLGYRAVFIFGHPDYYPRIGFKRAAEFGITTADGKNFDPFMAYPLYDGALDGLSGRLILDPVYEDSSEEDAAEFDKKFPPKELYVPIPAEKLLERLPAAAQKALTEFKGKSLNYAATKSEREIAAMEGVDGQAVEIIRAVMREYGKRWGAGR